MTAFDFDVFSSTRMHPAVTTRSEFDIMRLLSICVTHQQHNTGREALTKHEMKAGSNTSNVALYLHGSRGKCLLRCSRVAADIFEHLEALRRDLWNERAKRSNIELESHGVDN